MIWFRSIRKSDAKGGSDAKSGKYFLFYLYLEIYRDWKEVVTSFLRHQEAFASL